MVIRLAFYYISCLRPTMVHNFCVVLFYLLRCTDVLVYMYTQNRFNCSPVCLYVWCFVKVTDYTYGSVASYTCSEGYYSNGADATQLVSCSEQATWTPVLHLACVRISCPSIYIPTKSTCRYLAIIYIACIRKREK